MTPKQINKLRRDLGLTQEQLAAIIGTEQYTVSSWETSKARPRGKNLKALQELQQKAKAEAK